MPARSTSHVHRFTALGAVAVLVVASVVWAPAPAAAVPPSTPITIEGGGWGHGIGMPQYGARGMAEGGATHQEILTYFYTGASVAQVSATNGASLPDTIRVGTNLAGGEVRPFLWLDFAAVGGPVELCLPGEAAGECSLAPSPGETWRVSWDEPSQECRISQNGSVVHASDGCDFRLEWEDQPNTRVSIPEVGRVFARGAIEFIGPVTYNQRGFHTVVELSLEEYLYGIAEMPTSWPTEALRAQVVAARTFAAETTRRRIFVYGSNGGVRYDCSCHLVWGTSDQAYRGWHSLNEGNATHGADWRAAVDDTAGQVVVADGGEMVEAYYHSSTGGATENAWDVWGPDTAWYRTKYSYLSSVADPWSELYAGETSRIRWTKTMTAAAVAAALGFDEVVSMKVVSRYDSGSPSDVAVRGLLDGSIVTKHFTGGQLKVSLGLTSHHIYSIEGFALPERVAGADRYETAVAASARTHPSGADTVYVAVGTNHPDALSAGPAAAVEGAPILLVQKAGLPPVTRAELQRLDPSTVVVLGGPAAISADVVDAIRGAVPGAAVERRAGDDRYGTSVSISESVFGPGIGSVFVATGDSFPDALVAAPSAVAAGSPLLLVRSGSVPAIVKEEIRRLAPAQIVVVGGTGAVSAAVADELKSIAPVQRISAGDRYAVSAAVSAATYPQGSGVAYVAVGDDFPDALAAGPFTAWDPGPLLLVRTHSLPSSVAAELERLDPSRIVIFGGPAAVSESVAELVATYQD